jgi:bacterioferritin
MGEFAFNIERVRARARQHMEAGATIGGYKADRERVIAVLNQVLATEIVCILRV